MSATRREREQFIATCSTYGIRYDDARRLLSFAATLQRVSEAQCNGDWPYDNGERATVPCSKCEAGTVRSYLKRMPGAKKDSPASLLLACPGCRTEERARKFVSEMPHAKLDQRDNVWFAMFQGDPRGYVFSLHLGLQGPIERVCIEGNCQHFKLGVPA